MKRNIYLLFFALILISCAKKQVKEYFETGELKTEFEINSDSLKDGEQIEYFPTGKKKSVINWKNGIRDGEIFHFYESGELKFKGTFVNGKLNNIGITLYPSGQLKQKATFQSEDTYQFRTFYLNGYPQLSGRLYAGKNVGEFIEYSNQDSGKIKEVMHMVCDDGEEINSFGVIYDEKGNVLKRSKFNIKVKSNDNKNQNQMMIFIDGLSLDSTYIVIGYNVCFNDTVFSLDTLRGSSNKFEYVIPNTIYGLDDIFIGCKMVNFQREISDDGYVYLKEYEIPFYIKMPELPPVQDIEN